MPRPNRDQGGIITVEKVMLLKKPLQDDFLKSLAEDLVSTYSSGTSLSKSLGNTSSLLYLNKSVSLVLEKGIAAGLFPKKPAPGQSAEVGGKTYVFQALSGGGGRWTLASGQKQEEKERPAAQEGKKRPDVKESTAIPEETAPIVKTADEKLRAAIDREFKTAKFVDTSLKSSRRDGTRSPIKGRAIGGVVVHQEGQKGKKPSWVVSHQGSGKRLVGGFGDENHANISAMRLSRVFDWGKRDSEITRDPLFAAVGRFALNLKANPYAISPSLVTRERKAYGGK